MTTLPEESIEQLVSGVTPGGHYKPPECQPRSRVAIIIPYRDRVENLNAFLYHMHPFLQKQQLEYGIIVVEQEGKFFSSLPLFPFFFLICNRKNDVIFKYDFFWVLLSSRL